LKEKETPGLNSSLMASIKGVRARGAAKRPAAVITGETGVGRRPTGGRGGPDRWTPPVGERKEEEVRSGPHAG
jgi:hypothetical protein